MLSDKCPIPRRSRKEVSIPGSIFAYFSLCKELKNKTKSVQSGSVKFSSDLPFVSKMTEQFTPLGVARAHWSFLRY